RLGISYRSESDVRMKGQLDWDFTDLRASTLGSVVTGDLPHFLEQYYRPDVDARLIFTIPAKLNIGFFTQVSERMDLMLNYTFNRTSAVKDLTVEL
ncbi:hypothetical protein ABTJ45_19750, partial [Acinetobacter baumannii]